MERIDRMKGRRSRVGLALCGVMALLSSCLDEVNTVYNPGDTPAVTRQAADGNIVADTRYGTVYASQLSSNNSGTCLLVNFTYHADDPAQMNTSETGYYSVYLQNQSAVNQLDLQAPLTPVDRLLPNELPIDYAVSTHPDNQRYIAFIDNFLFLPTQYRAGEGQTVRWQMSFDPSAGATSVDGVSAYHLYLRAYATAPRGENAVDTTRVALNAFNLSPLLQTVGEGATRDLHVAIHYVTNINAADSSQFVWTEDAPLQIQ